MRKLVLIYFVCLSENETTVWPLRARPGTRIACSLQRPHFDFLFNINNIIITTVCSQNLTKMVHKMSAFRIRALCVSVGWKSTSFWAIMLDDHSFWRFFWAEAEFIAAVFGKIWRRQSGRIGTNWFLLIIQLVQLDHFAASKSSQIKRQWTQLNKTYKMSGFPTL